MGLAADTEYTITINTTGKIGDGTTCDEVGEEYNPLAEIDKYGNQNPYQDPARGTINARKLTTDGSGAITVAPSSEAVILQNLEGKDGIIGRSITLLDAADAVVACCVVARDMLPPQFVEPEFYPAGNQSNYGAGHYGH